jgi:hypothetical protein
MGDRPDQRLRFRGALLVFAAAFIATAATLAFSGEGPVVGSAAPARDQVADDDDPAVGVVRARGGGVATPARQTAAPAPAATDRLLAIREQAEEEIRDRLGDEEAGSPERENVVEEVVGLVEDGADLQEAVEEILGPREEPAPSPTLPLPLP